MRTKIFFIGFSILSTCLFAEPKDDSAEPQAGSAFYLESGLVEKIHQESVSSLDAARRQSYLLAGIGYTTFSELTVKNEYFETDYADQVKSIPVLEVMLVKEQYDWRYVSLNFTGAVGYSLVQRALSSRSSDDVIISDNLTTQWLPIHVGSSVSYNFSNSFSWIRPSLDFAAGTNWIHQSGNVDGMDHSQWSPDLQFGLSFLLFSNFTNDEFGFSGFNIGYGNIVSFSGDKTLAGRRLSIGTSILL